MSMGAITENYGTGDACVKAVKAGIDMVLMPENLEEAYNAVLEAVKNGEISQERLDDAVSRIIKAKNPKRNYKIGGFYEKVHYIINSLCSIGYGCRYLLSRIYEVLSFYTIHNFYLRFTFTYLH